MVDYCNFGRCGIPLCLADFNIADEFKLATCFGVLMGESRRDMV